MKLLFFNEFRLGVLVDSEHVVDVSDVVDDRTRPQEVMQAVIENWATYESRIAERVGSGERVPRSEVRIRPPLPRPMNIDCMAVNYMEDGTRPEAAPINAFLKSSNAVIGEGDEMILPDVPATVFEGEAELALVIGRRGSNIPAADAMSYIFGYTNLIDGSARGLPPAGNTFFQIKSRDTFCPIGPCIVTADEIADPQELGVRLWNNGELMQHFNTSDMAHNIAECIAFVSSVHTIEPGDILATGTNHRGLHPFMDGDRIELEIDGLERLSIGVRDSLHRTWRRETRLSRQEAGESIPTSPQLSGKYAPLQ